jgi:ABC-2 type transport system ATP-binding protein
MAGLELTDLRKRYGVTVALDGLGFDVEPGHVFGFVGPNGAGKTTTMRIVMGVLQQDAGEVRWRGEPADAAVRRRFGYMPEERGLYPKMAVGEQLAYFAELHGLDPDAARERAATWMERLGIAGRKGDKVEELSLGNQQRVQLGVALVHDPELLVLDEPFSGLDPVGVDVLSEVLLGVARERGVPVIFSSHQLDLVERLCDAVAIILDGRLVATGLVDELRRERAGRRWRVDLHGGDAWEPGIAGVRRVGDGLYELDDGADPQALLDAARRVGAVKRFGADVPSLAELFRDVAARAEPGVRPEASAR